MKGKGLKHEYPFVVRDTDRHGNVRLYYRRKGKRKVRLFETPGTDAFAVEIEAAAGSVVDAPSSRDAVAPGSLRALVIAYKASTAFHMLDPRTQRVRLGILEGICQARIKSGAERGTLPVARMEARHVEEIRDEKADLPEAANGRVKALRSLFKWALKARKVKHNPAREVGYFSSATGGFHTWTLAEVRQYEDAHPVGTKARLALAILLFTGVRRSDAVKLGRGSERDGWLHFTETKNARSKLIRRREGPKVRALPILPVLRAIIDASPTGDLVYLVTEAGVPFTANGFGNRFKKWCTAAGLPAHCSAHGLRKAGATIAADNGATEHQLMAIYGWDTPAQAALYTRKANRTRLAASAMHLLMPPENENGASVSHPNPRLAVPPK